MGIEVMEWDRRFGGLSRLYGVDAADRVRSGHVAVVGIGGVGSWVAEALSRTGVGRLTLIDMDHVAESNINRQVHANSQTVGQSKVLAMQERIALINPECVVNTVDEFVEVDTWEAMRPVLNACDLVIDACDAQMAKRLMVQWAGRVRANKHIKLLVCGAAGGKKFAHRVELGDLAEVTHDPLLAKLRYQLRKEGWARTGKMHVDCVFSREAVMQPHASCLLSGSGDHSLNCHGFGSSVAVTGAFGLIASSWAIEKLSMKA